MLVLFSILILSGCGANIANKEKEKLKENPLKTSILSLITLSSSSNRNPEFEVSNLEKNGDLVNRLDLFCSNKVRLLLC